MITVNRIFIDTTDPETTYSRLFSMDVFINIIIHAIVYTIIYVIICKLFGFTTWKKYTVSLFIGLVLLMIIGYISRLNRVKSLAKVVKSKEYAKQQVRNGYFTWYFLG